MKNILAQDGNRVIFETDNEDEIVLKFTDDIVDGRGNAKGSSKNKAAVNATMTTHIFKVLSSYHVPTFFKSQKSAKELGLHPSKLIEAMVIDQLSSPKDDFLKAAKYVLEKNRELYKRLS